MKNSKRLWIVVLAICISWDVLALLGLPWMRPKFSRNSRAFEKEWLKKLNEQGKYGVSEYAG